jgi:hypothetical protein
MVCWSVGVNPVKPLRNLRKTPDQSCQNNKSGG